MTFECTKQQIRLIQCWTRFGFKAIKSRSSGKRDGKRKFFVRKDYLFNDYLMILLKQKKIVKEKLKRKEEKKGPSFAGYASK